MKPKLIIAGPGAGKTHRMVSLISEAIPLLHKTRLLIAITYTNSAAASIKTGLSTRFQIPPNIFIGTTYSFFSRYIIQPYASIFRKDINMDKMFLDIDIAKVITQATKGKSFAIKNLIRANTTKKLFSNGHIPLSEIGHISYTILEKNKPLRALLSNRLQYLFIDEFQDVDNWQYKIFDELRKAKKTKIYVVGDPEQYISGFTYINSTANKPEFSRIPINKFSANSEKEIIKKNYRSFEGIVRFINQFHTELDQVSQKGACKDSGVYFILGESVDQIIQKTKSLFDQISWETKGKVPQFFYLAHENKEFEEYSSKYGLTPLSNGNNLIKNPFQKSLELLNGVTGSSSKQIKESYCLDDLEYRRLGFQLIKAIQGKSVRNVIQLLNYISQDLELEIDNSSNIEIGKGLDSIIKSLSSLPTPDKNHLYSSIHKAKGLEADGVLAIAKTNAELSDWLTTEKSIRHADKTDRCRIGYVAFSRAKQVLCVASKKPVGEELMEQIRNLGMKII